MYICDYIVEVERRVHTSSQSSSQIVYNIYTICSDFKMLSSIGRIRKIIVIYLLFEIGPFVKFPKLSNQKCLAFITVLARAQVCIDKFQKDDDERENLEEEIGATHAARNLQTKQLLKASWGVYDIC